ncbi:hypothetical protein N665_0042s0032 [Sinapis alba]|nr:hypothetical protein N665_0042s0032 [Sinapis alba]
MIIQASLVCMFTLSFFALHQCEMADVREIMEPNIVISSNCYHGICSGLFIRNCWCCGVPHGLCYDSKPSCDAVCPRPHSPPK